MLKVYKAMAAAVAAVIGASGALAGGSQAGVIYFTGAIVQAGFRVQQSLGAENALQARASASGDQVVLDFRSAAVRVVPVASAARSINTFCAGVARRLMVFSRMAVGALMA